MELLQNVCPNFAAVVQFMPELRMGVRFTPFENIGSYQRWLPRM